MHLILCRADIKESSSLTENPGQGRDGAWYHLSTRCTHTQTQVPFHVSARANQPRILILAEEN